MGPYGVRGSEAERTLSSIVSIRLTLVIQKLAIESISLVVDLLYKVTECSGYTFATI